MSEESDAQREVARIALAGIAEAGFELSVFTQQLEAVRRVTPLDVQRYGVSAERLEA